MTAPITCAASLLVNTRVNLVNISILKISRYVCWQHWCWLYNLQFYYSKVVSVIRVANRIPKKPMDLGQSTLLSSSVVSQPLFPTKSASKSSTPILDLRLKRAQIQIIGSSWTDTWSELLWTDPVDTFLQMCAGEKQSTRQHSLININNLHKTIHLHQVKSTT